MRNRPLGSTGIEVSELALGTVELGIPYGFSGSAHYQPPEAAEAIQLLRTAFDAGITLVDTAPTYGIAEELIGRAFEGRSARPLIATKVRIPDNGDLDVVTSTIENSLRLLRVDAIDLLQIHNTSIAVLERESLFDRLEEIRRQGKIRFLGGSADDEKTAWTALSNKHVETLQIPFNLLNQNMRRRVFPAALEPSRGILIRSAYLRGVLTDQLESIPPRLSPLKTAARRAWKIASVEAPTLSGAALRFCLSFKCASSVIVGMRSAVELERNIITCNKGPLSPRVVEELEGVAVEDEKLINPIYWQDLI